MRRQRTLRAIAVSTLALVPAHTADAQTSKIEPNQRYLLIATQKTGTMQTELNEAAAQGFRVVAGSPTSQGEMVLFLERVAQPPETYAYRLLATAATSTMAKELNSAAAEGFRLMPQTAMAQASAGRKLLLGGAATEIIVVLERAPKTGKRYEYKLLATSKTATMQKEVSQTVADGFVLIALLSRDEHMVVMEKERED